MEFDFPLPQSVLSTIAIALSPNGETVATTHGDHTVKIHDYEKGIVIKELSGHPRTPWTVKYHPYNSNIIASGCLGFEVRIWDISEGVQLNMIRYDFSIISLSFHPFLPILAIAAGPKLRIFNWQDKLNKVKVDTINNYTNTFRNSKNLTFPDYYYSDLNYLYETMSPTSISSNIVSSSTILYHIIQHTRNIRAVLFHPNGKYLLTAAPDPPIGDKAPDIACRLYFYPIDLLMVKPFETHKKFNNSYINDLNYEYEYNGVEIINLISLPYILEQIHLYSDGGLDISEDGDYIFTCATLNNMFLRESFGTNSNIKSLKNDILNSQREHESISTTKRSFEELLLSNPTPPRILFSNSKLTSNNDTKTQFNKLEPKLLKRFNNLDNIANNNNNNNNNRIINNNNNNSNNNNNNNNFNVNSISSSNITNFNCLTRPVSAMPFQNVRRFPHLSDTKIHESLENHFNDHVNIPIHNNIISNNNNFTNNNDTSNNNINMMEVDAHIEFCNGDIDVSTDENNYSDEEFESINTIHIANNSTSNSNTYLTNNNNKINNKINNVNTTANNNNNNNNNIPLINDKWNLLPSSVFSTNNLNVTNNNFKFKSPLINKELENSLLTFNHNRIKTNNYLCLFKLINIHTHSYDSILNNDTNYITLSSTTLNSLSPINFQLSPIVPVLVGAKPLTSNLMSTITSTKLSPSKNIGLVGFGVRTQGVVFGHNIPLAACEIIDLGTMKTLSVLTDSEDEVNIAQFHPIPGNGILYGTKKGKVRKFQRYCQLFEIINNNNDNNNYC